MAEQKKRIVVNAFEMTCIGHQSFDLWRHPRSRATEYNTIKYWTDLAKTLERGLFDAVFIADVVGIYDVYKNSAAPAIEGAAQVPVNDPATQISAMAAVTEHLGFGVTAAATFEQPYTLARRYASLDHLTEGRVGFNVVTSYLPSATTSLTSSWTSATSCGKAPGKTAQSSRTASAASTLTPPRFTRLATRASTSPYPASP